MSRNLFDISEEHLGKRVVATVTIQEKTVTREVPGKEDEVLTFTLLDVHRTDGEATHELKLVDERRSDDDVAILNSEKFFHFKPIVK